MPDPPAGRRTRLACAPQVPILGRMSWDRAVLEAIDRHRVAWLDDAARRVMDVGQPKATYVVALLLALAFGLVFRAWRTVAAALAASVVATAVAEWAKEVIGRSRPPAGLALVPTDGTAMPSSIGAMTAGAAVPLILWGLHRADVLGRAVAAALVVGTALIGASMVYLGAHWLGDVLAGWALGAALGVAAFRLLVRPPAQRRGRLPADTPS
jgi:membrane-associated phospholipid phosphatase